MVSSTWCTVAPVINYWDFHGNFGQPLHMAGGVVLGPIQDWAKSKEAVDSLNGVKRNQVLNEVNFSFSLEYQAVSLGEADSEWDGPETRSKQDKAEELIQLANFALWLACPSSMGFSVMFHFDQLGLNPRFRQSFSSQSLIAHSRDKETEPAFENFRQATNLHEVLINLPRKGTVWTAARILWKALHESMWEVRFLLTWVAMEALYGPLNPQETTYRLSQRAAFFLGSNGGDARELFQMVKTGYGWRSKVVHGLRLNKLSPEESEKISHEAETLVRKTFLRILKNPEMVNKFDGNTREDFLDGLIFDSYQPDFT